MDILTPDAIANKLTHQTVINDIGQCRFLLSRVLVLSTAKSCDLSPLIAPIVNLLAHSDILVKKTACTIITKLADCKSEVMLLAVNTLLKDSRDSNPMIRGLALRTLCSVNHHSFVEHRLPCVLLGLGDSSSYVRRTAAIACVTISKTEREHLVESGIVDKLYGLIRDCDPIVVVNCILALEELLQKEEGIVMNKNMVKYLLSRLHDFTAWGVGYTLTLVKKYKPVSEEEIFDLMNILDGYLQHNSCSASVQALELFMHLISDMPQLKQEVYQRVVNTFLSVFSSGNVEMIMVAMQYLQKQDDLLHETLSKEHKAFFCRHKDPVYLKEEKLRVQAIIINDGNFKDIFEEIVLNCSDKSEKVSLVAIQSLGHVLKKFPDLSESLLQAFKKLLSSETDHILSNALQVLVTLPVEQMAVLDDITTQLCVVTHRIQDTEGVTAALNVIGRFGGCVSDSLILLEDYIEKFATLDQKVKGQLLITGVKLFCKNPAQYQNIAGELIDLCLHDDCDQGLQDQARFYYLILEADVKTAMAIFNDV